MYIRTKLCLLAYVKLLTPNVPCLYINNNNKINRIRLSHHVVIHELWIYWQTTLKGFVPNSKRWDLNSHHKVALFTNTNAANGILIMKLFSSTLLMKTRGIFNIIYIYIFMFYICMFYIYTHTHTHTHTCMGTLCDSIVCTCQKTAINICS